MEVLATIVGKIWDCSFDATCRQFGYLYGYKDRFERLRIEAQKLKYTRERVQGKIDEATTKGEIILSDVTNWIQRVDDITKEAEHFREDEDQANKRCLKGMCIDPCSRYKFGKEAQRKIDAISNLLEEEARRFDQTVSRKSPLPGILTSSALSVNFQSRESIKMEIMETLKDENVSIIGICGMGGVGKTTLVNETSKQAIENEVFDTVAMAVVSQTQNYLKIQGDIAKMLGFTLPDDNDESARARFLWHMIKEKRKLKTQVGEEKPKLELEQILIILDDVWEGIELDRIGIPFGNNRRGCKIVLTSRIEDVCIEMNAQTFTVGTLRKKESWGLFRNVAGEIVDNSDINPIAREVADECGGLPIAIVTVAGALKNRNSKYVWIDAAQQLKKSAPTNIKGMDRKVFASLEWSYNFLGSEELKSVFLLCCLFPEDFNIPIELLMRYGMGLRLFQEVDTVEEARGRTHTVVSALTSCFLLLTGYDENHVKMHDVIRDYAIKLSKDKHTVMAKAGIGLRVWPSADTYENFTRISLMYNDIHEGPDHGLEYTKLQALLLQQNSSLVVSNDFFQGMKDLKVLDMSCIRRLPLTPSLVHLASLTMLCLDYCIFGDEAEVSLIGKLTTLEIVSLKGTDIKQITGDFGQLVKLRFFDLTGCFNLRQIPQAVILCLKKLEELYVSNSHSYEEMVIHFQVLSRQTILLIRTQEQEAAELANSLCRTMTFQNSTGFSITIGNGNINPLEKHQPWSRFLYISDISYQQVGWPYELMKIVEVLQLCEIVGLRNILPDLGNHGFNGLKCLELNDCREITYLLNTFECTPPHLGSVAFNSLEYLRMEHIPNLVEICHGPLPPASFCKVKRIHISYCDNMSNIAPSHLVQRLQSLESFEACNCDSVVYAFDFEGLVIARQPNFFSSLNYLRLVGLPELTQIWNGDAKLISLRNLERISVYTCSKLRQVFPPALLQNLVSLESMEISECDSLEEIFGKEEEEEEEDHHQENEIVELKIDHTTTSPSLGKLTFIHISDCNKLKNLFTPSIVKGLVQLITLEVDLCRTMEEIVSDEKAETGASTESITFPSLKSISLGELGSLTCFCAGRCTIKFPSLEFVYIEKCPKMETFGCGDQVTPKLNMIRIEREKRWMDNLNITVQQFYKE